MGKTKSLCCALVLAMPSVAQAETLERKWHLGLHLGELPWDGSFKLGVQAGYHFNDFFYVGLAYQIPDQIQRDGSSFNARRTNLGGILSSKETVGQRMYLQARVRPHRLSPYLSLGVVYNDADTERVRYDGRSRIIGSGTYTGEVTVVQTRPAGLRPALGLGYEYTFDFGLSLYAEWSGWWLVEAPKPRVSVQSVAGLSAEDEAALVSEIEKAFQSSVFNTYHIFQFGLGYTF